MDGLCKHVLVSGRVQGVGFRWYVRSAARELGVAGWVRNLPDGRVEAELEGSREAVERMLAKLRTGPPGAGVSALEVSEGEVRGHAEFEIVRGGRPG